jgi:trehalose 6-phosphate synthase
MMAPVSEHLVVVSNRGPVSYERGADGTPVPKRGGGGLVSTLAPAVEDTGALWMAAALSDAEREIAGRGTIDAEGFRLRFLDIDEDTYKGYYDGVCNRTLWFAYHGLDARPLSPSLDPAWHVAWESFVDVNQRFAKAVADEAPEGATVLVHDLHLSLVGAVLRQERPDLATAHFSHTPFCWPQGLDVLPAARRRQLLEGLAAHGACGFHSGRWARAFLACCAEEGVEPPTTFIAPAAADPTDVLEVSDSDACAAHLARFESLAAGRKVISRVDRMELSKNVVRGFTAFDLLLERSPRWREEALFLACCYPSRLGVPEYAAYRDAVEAEVQRVNDRWGPVIHLLTDDDFPRSVAALRLADVALVNPIRDGMNVVAKELAIVNDRDAILCLSPHAGVWDELGEAGALETPPFDLVATADALEQALLMDPSERASRAASLRKAATATTPDGWLRLQIDAAR